MTGYTPQPHPASGGELCEHEYNCDRCQDTGYVYPDDCYGTRDDDIPCPECSRGW